MKKLICFLTFIIIANCSLLIENCSSQWYQQTLPVSGQIDDMAFLNKDTGFIAMGSGNKLLRTLNGGTNWDIIRDFRIYQLEKIDNKTLYAINYDGNKLYRTFDGGTVWDSLGFGACGISFINRDTGWASYLNGIYKTTDGGITTQLISSQPTCGKIVMLKQKYGNEYAGFHLSSGFLYKTTNSGVNWTNVPNPLGGGDYGSIYFLNKDTGWSYFSYNLKNPEFIYTSNGGLNWVTQFIDSLNYNCTEIFFADFKHGWGSRSGNKIYATSNGGLIWGIQTSPLYLNYQLYFIDSLTGWCGGSGNLIAKTTNGGGAIVSIQKDSSRNIVPKSFVLSQNYPNPFNPSTSIEFYIPFKSTVKLTVYDIGGREIIRLIDNRDLDAGKYKTGLDLNGMSIPSGAYFYTLTASDKSKQVFRQTRKMIYVK